MNIQFVYMYVMIPYFLVSKTIQTIVILLGGGVHCLFCKYIDMYYVHVHTCTCVLLLGLWNSRHSYVDIN